MVKKRHIVFSIILVAVVILTFTCTRAIFKNDIETANQHQLINPVVESELKKHFIINFQPLRDSFVTIQKKYPQKTYAYFAYLNNAAWVGVNERDTFVAASLVKVPLAMAVYAAIEDGKLDEDAIYGLEEININNSFGVEHNLSEGDSVTVEQLIEIMLTKSDNTAANALYTILNRVGIEDPLNDIYAAMGWDFKDSGDSVNYGLIHVKILSNMFLSLYNATYVNPDHSESILRYLTKTEFDQEIEKGVPDSIPVSHKVGIYEAEDVYSDCGIVYAPNREYILCLGSSGGSVESARSFMAEISKAAYDYVIKN